MTPRTPSSCSCAGPERFRAYSRDDDYERAFATVKRGAAMWASGVVSEWAVGQVARAVPAVAPAAHVAEGWQAVGGVVAGKGAVLLAIAAVSDLAEVVLANEGIHPWDVRHDTPGRHAAMRSVAEGLRTLPALPADAADLVALHEEVVELLDANAVPREDPCGWYRFGWATHNHVMEAMLEDAGLAAALALAAAEDDGPTLMRLAAVPPAEVGCTRFWFGIRDANRQLASVIKGDGTA